MIYSETINGLPLTTGDIICTTDGTDTSLIGKAWQMLGLLVPGKIDHVVLYVGPNGGCIEAGAKGVIFFEMPNHCWDAECVADTRFLHDSLVGVAYPFQNRTLSARKERQIRRQVAQFCIEQLGKPYNFNIFDKEVDSAFYCSQLVYQAYLSQGIDLLHNHTQIEKAGKETGKEDAPMIITPQMIWESCVHQIADSAAPI